MNNSMKLEFLSISENESFARTAIAAYVSQLNPTLDELDDIKTAVSEAVTNAIVHGYKHTTGTIQINCILSNNQTIISVSDTGCGIENISRARTPLYTSAEDNERSGLGFTVMETFMDSVDVISSPGKGTVVTMKKRIGYPNELTACV